MCCSCVLGQLTVTRCTCLEYQMWLQTQAEHPHKKACDKAGMCVSRLTVLQVVKCNLSQPHVGAEVAAVAAASQHARTASCLATAM
jgi:hypothetical protein